MPDNYLDNPLNFSDDMHVINSRNILRPVDVSSHVVEKGVSTATNSRPRSIGKRMILL